MSDALRHILRDIRLDEASLSNSAPEMEQERRVAIFDLLEANRFEVVGHDAGPYALTLAMLEQRRLAFAVADAAGAEIRVVILSLAPLSKIVRDYFMICDSYNAAIRTATPGQIEALDMARRGLHNEAGELLIERLAGKIVIDLDTARRFFTLICALHVRT
jgi:uncharacterized protein (UPF0262 family)